LPLRARGGINHLDGKNLPSKQAITSITKNLLRLLFPGFFDEKLIHSSEIKWKPPRSSILCSGTSKTKSIKASSKSTPERPKKDLRPYAHTLTIEFLASFTANPRIASDGHRSSLQWGPGALSKEEVIVAYPFIEAIAVQRLAQRALSQEHSTYPADHDGVGPCPHGDGFTPRAQIGTHFFVRPLHRNGDWRNQHSRQSRQDVSSVGLVAKSLSAGQLLKGQKRHPTIEDRVTIYAGATIMGGDTVVGEGSTIGANVFLTSSVPAHSLVVQEEANVRVMSKKDRQKPETNSILIGTTDGPTILQNLGEFLQFLYSALICPRVIRVVRVSPKPSQQNEATTLP